MKRILFFAAFVTLIASCGQRAEKAENDDSLPDAPLNLIVLTANPLMDGKDELFGIVLFNDIGKCLYRKVVMLG